MYARLAAEVDHREQEIAELGFQRRVTLVVHRRTLGRPLDRVVAQLRPNLAQFLLDLRRRPVDIRPVEADTRRAVLETMRAVQRWQVRRQPFFDRGALPRLHLLPGLSLAPLIQVRVPATHLRDQPRRHISDVEGTALLGNHGVKEDLEQDVTELLAHLLVIAFANGLVELVGFLDQVGAEGVVRLGRIPLAARSEVTHESERIFKRWFVLHSLLGSGIIPAPRMSRQPTPAHTRAWVEIDLGALRRNGAALAARAGVPLLAVIKADGYGLGATRVAQALEPLEPWGFGVATVSEGIELREAGVARPILILSPILIDDHAAAREAHLRPSLGDADAITRWRSVAGAPWHLSIDTGMSRAGAPWTTVASLRDALTAAPPEGAYTHFHSADLDDGSVVEQLRRFRCALDAMPARPRYLHAENSPALERGGASPWDLARPGVFLYGSGGGEGATLVPEPVAHLRARVLEIRTVPDGDTVSYGATWRARGDRRIATLGIGYADGYRRAFSNRGVALVRGRRVPIAGIVTMDMVMLDVTDVRCEVGDVATLIGRDGDEVLTIDEVAHTAQVLSYEILVGLKLRVPRVYVA